MSSLSALQQGDHVCAIYDSPEEQLATISEYIKAGLDAGERCLYIVDNRTAEDVLGGMAAAGIDVATAQAGNRLALATKRESYLHAGSFDPDAMLASVARLTDQALADGCTGLRVAGEMTWALGDEVGCDRIIEYETKLNRFFPGSRAHAICQYSRERFSPAIVRDVLRTHPFAVLGNLVCPNLYYEPPELLGLPDADRRRVNHMIDQLLQAQLREEELAKAVALRDDFLSVASHELKTPVNALRLALAVARRRHDIPGEPLDRLDAQVGRVAELVDRLLDVSRVSENRFEIEPEDGDVGALVRDRVAAFQPLAEAAGTPLIADAGHAPARFDRLRLEQIVDNLLSNAVKYGEGRPIEVTVRASDASTIIRVRDRGIGIPLELQDQLFKRFVRLHSSKTFGGFGLGLWIARELAHRMGGCIDVESAPGSGSTFTVTLPRRGDAPVAH